MFCVPPNGLKGVSWYNYPCEKRKGVRGAINGATLWAQKNHAKNGMV